VDHSKIWPAVGAAGQREVNVDASTIDFPTAEIKSCPSFVEWLCWRAALKLAGCGGRDFGFVAMVHGDIVHACLPQEPTESDLVARYGRPGFRAWHQYLSTCSELRRELAKGQVL